MVVNLRTYNSKAGSAMRLTQDHASNPYSDFVKRKPSVQRAMHLTCRDLQRDALLRVSTVPRRETDTSKLIHIDDLTSATCYVASSRGDIVAARAL